MQVKYANFSGNRSVNTLVSTNHLSAIESAFNRLKAKVGDIDEFVRAELQYEPEQFKKSFSAEQVEALALAIDNIGQGKGFIIGDQTGIGKGRVVAAMIRYAKLNGKTPVFVTQMPDLYGDMMRDLNDIGMGNTKPLMTNNNASVPLDAEALSWFSEKQGIQTRITELLDAMEGVAIDDLGEKATTLAPDERAKSIALALKTSTNPEMISLRDEIKELKASLPERRGKFLDTPAIESHEKSLKQMVQSNSIGDHDVIFTTYNQMAALDSGKPKKNKETGVKKPASAPVFGYRSDFLDHFVNAKSMLILDESHNAGEAGDGKFPKVGDVVRRMIAKSGGVFYSSATFAKNTAVMDVYSKTDLGSAFDTPDALVSAVNSVPMQQITSSMLVEAGQYLRRERSFDGIEYKTETVEVDQQAAEDMATAMRMVVEFDTAKKSAIAELQNQLDQEGAVMAAVNGGGSMGSVDSMNFTSVMHNVVNTFLLALKADAAAKTAIDAIRAGEKPVITVANTMEMFITEFAKDSGLGVGDKLNATFADVLKRYLDKTRKASIKHANGESEVVSLTDEQLGPDGVDAYNAAYEFIDEMNLDIPISPIDHIKQRIEEAGFSIGEITGRQTVVVNGVLRSRNKAELNTAGKKNTIAKYNGGTLDALIINRSGSTGLSMHASETFADQRKRVMIVAQAELDINNHMQMLGRINRTGQVTANGKSAYAGPAQYGLPRYAQMTANVPIELRPAAVLSNKMAGLNANTTAGRKSSVEDKSALDFMNKYGDRVAAEMVGGNSQLNGKLGYPIKLDENGSPIVAGAISKVTGRIGLLPLSEQTDLYSQLATEYGELIAQLDALGQNELEAKTYPLDAETVESKVIQKADDKSTSPFTSAVSAEKVSMKKLGKPYPKAKVLEMVLAHLNGRKALDVRSKTLADVTGKIDEEVRVLMATRDAADAKDSASIQKQIDALALSATLIRGKMPTVGVSVMLRTDAGNMYGIVTRIDRTGKAKSAGSLSAWKVQIAVVDGARSMTLPLSQIYNGAIDVPPNGVVMSLADTMTIPNVARTGFDTVPVIEGFDRGQTDSRETRVIITGNILRGYGVLRGRLLNYTDNKGGIKQGILMPADFDMNAVQARFTASLKSSKEVIALLEKGGTVVDKSNGGETLRISMKNGSYFVEVSKTGLGKKLAKNAGDLNFVSSGNKMRVRVWDAEVLTDFLNNTVKPEGIALVPDSDSAKLVDGTAFSRSAIPARGLPTAEVTSIVDAIRARWGNAPEIIIAANMADPLIPQKVRDQDQMQKSQGATGEPEGFVYRGKVYILASELATPTDVMRVLFHESLGHLGLRGVFGDKLKPILDQITAMRRVDIIKKARQYGLVRSDANGDPVVDVETATDKEVFAAMDHGHKREAAEEVLAEMAQTKPELGYVQRAIGLIRGWLRANVPGFSSMKLTDAEIITNFILPARRFVEGKGGPKGGMKAPATGNITTRAAFGRGEGAAGQTDTPAFKAWFGDSKVVDAAGKPLVVYHGSNTAGITEFNTNAESNDGERGTFFSAKKSATEDYGSSLYESYLSIKTPYEVTSKQWAMGEGMTPVEARKAGHDGYIIRGLDGKGGDAFMAFNPTQIKSATGNNGDFDGTNPDIRFSRSLGATLTDVANNTQEALKNATVTDLLKQFGNRLGDFRGLGLQTLGRRQLVDIYGKDLPAMVAYSDMVAQMEADKNESGAEADGLATDWGKLKDERQLAELMHDATLAQIDPSKDFVEGDDANFYDALKDGYDKLTPDAKKAFLASRDMYSAHNEKVRKAIRERITRSELSSSKKQALLDRMDGEFFKKVKGVYFPLARFGSYVTIVKDSEGNVVSANRSETMNEAEATRKVLQTQFPAAGGFKVGKVLRDREFNAARDGVGRGFMADLFQTLEKTGAGEELMDSISQLYLAALPDLSWAKHGIHRKGTPGFSQDARRAFAQNMFHGARYLAKLRYADQLQTGLDTMQKQIADQVDNEAYDSVKAQQVADEMVKRHESLMNPESNPLSTALTSIGFVFHLGLSPASALVNLSQTALVALPIMGAKWGFTKSSAALLVASKQAAGNKNDISTVLKGDERTAYDEAVRRGVIDVTMAHDLAGIAQGEDSKVSAAFKPVMKYASFLFHHAEKFNRQVTFVAAYRLAREAGTAHEAAFDDAVKATYDGHFDYGAANRPRLMQGNVARVVFLFKQYSQNMIYTLTRNAQQAIKAETPEGRAEARKALAGMLVSHAMAAGVFGLPVVGMLLSAASAIGGDDDEPWDAKVALQNMLADSIGPKAAEVFAHGLSRLTPWDISGRVGLDRLLLPDVQEGLEGTRAAESWAAQALGPVVGIGINMVKGLSEMGKGEYQRGLESMLPSALRGPMKAYRLETEGNIDKSGVAINENVSGAGVAGQALGFSPSETRLAQEGKSAIYSADRAIQARRTNLVRQFALASMATDAEGVQDARKDIARFNEKNPKARITQTQLVSSIRARQRRINEAKQGVYLPSKRQDAMEAGRFAVTE